MFRLSRGFRSLLVVPALLAAAVLPACGGGGSDDAETVKIAVCGPMTGSVAAMGEMIKFAANLKAQEINDAGGLLVNGKRMMVETVIFDDKANTTEATNVARRVASDDSIVLVIGHFNSNCTLAAKEEYNRVGIVEFSPGSTNVKVCRGGPFTFRNLYRDDYQGEQLAIYAKRQLGLDNIAVLFENDDYGKGLMQSFKAQAKKEGLDIVAEVTFLRERTQDFKPLVQQAKDAGAQAIFVAGLYNEAALIAKSARHDHKMDVPILGGDGVMNQDFLKLAGDAAEGALVATPFLFNTGNDSEEAKVFLSAFKKAYSKEPDTWAALTYDAMGMALAAVEKVGVDRSAVRDALAAAKDEASGYVGVTGVTYFDDEGDCYSKNVYMAVAKDGKFVPAEKQIK